MTEERDVGWGDLNVGDKVIVPGEVVSLDTSDLGGGVTIRINGNQDVNVFGDKAVKMTNEVVIVNRDWYDIITGKFWFGRQVGVIDDLSHCYNLGGVVDHTDLNLRLVYVAMERERDLVAFKPAQLRAM